MIFTVLLALFVSMPTMAQEKKKLDWKDGKMPALTNVKDINDLNKTNENQKTDKDSSGPSTKTDKNTNVDNNGDKIIRTINSKVLELHDTFIQERTNKCNELLK